MSGYFFFLQKKDRWNKEEEYTSGKYKHEKKKGGKSVSKHVEKKGFQPARILAAAGTLVVSERW